MELTSLNILDSNQRAISPVVGVVLLVAITLVLSVAVGVFLFDIGNNTSQTATAGINTDESPSGTTIQVTTMGTAERVYVKHNGTEKNLTVGETYTVPSGDEWGVIAVSQDGNENVLTTSDDYSGGTVTGGGTGATVTVIESPFSATSASELETLSNDTYSTYSTNANGYPVLESNSTDIQSGLFTEEINNTKEIDEIEISPTYEVNQGGTWMYIDQYDSSNSRTERIGKSQNSTYVFTTSGTQNYGYYMYPGLYGSSPSQEHVLKTVDITAYNVTTSEENFPTYFTTTSDFEDYRSSSNGGAATVTADSIEYADTDGNWAKYNFKTINTSDTALDDIKITTNIASTESTVYLYVYDDTGSRIGYAAISNTASNTTVSITDAISQSTLDNNNKLQLGLVRSSGNTTINDVTVNGYAYDYTTNPWDTNLTTDTELTDYSVSTETNATIQNNNVTIDNANNEVWSSKWLNNKDYDGYAVRTEVSGDALRIDMEATDNYDYDSTNYLGGEYKVSTNNDHTIHLTEYDTLSFESLGAYNGVSFRFTNDGGTTEVDYISITPYNYTNSTYFTKQTQTELETAEWNNTTVSVSSGTVELSPGNDDIVKDYVMSSNNVSLVDDTQVMKVVVKGSNLDGPSFTIGKEGGSYSVSSAAHKGNATYRYVEFDARKATLNNGPVFIGMKQSETQNITIDSIEVIKMDGVAQTPNSYVVRQESSYNVTYTNETRTEVTTG